MNQRAVYDKIKYHTQCLVILNNMCAQINSVFSSLICVDKLILFFHLLLDHPPCRLFSSVYQVFWRTNFCPMEVCFVTKENTFLLTASCRSGLL